MGYIYKKNKMKMTGLYIVYDAGSNKETNGKFGTMHLMEHLICKTFISMYDELTTKNIVWNAHTNRQYIMVYFTGLSSQLNSQLKEKLVGKLLGGVDGITEDIFNKEKGVVLQEYKDVFNDDSSGHLNNYLRLYYNDYGAIGRYKDIEAFTYSDFVETYESYFKNPFKIVEIGPEKTESFSEIEYKDKLDIVPSFEYKESGYRDIELEKMPEFDKFQYFKFGKLVSKRDFHI